MAVSLRSNSGGGAFFFDDGPCQDRALAAFGLATERLIHLARGHGTGASRIADLGFPNGIADADDQGALHRLRLSSSANESGSQAYCEAFAEKLSSPADHAATCQPPYSFQRPVPETGKPGL